jgi:Holliday junction DNA helicase RuvA
MLSHVTGKVSLVSDGCLTLDIAGFGLQFQVPNPSLFKDKEIITLQLYMHWSSENGPSFFGFLSETEKKLFLLVISCSGIGPKMALSLLAQLPPALLIKAVQENDEKALSSVSGIGPKKAEQIIVQLRHKLPKLLDSGLIVDGEDAVNMQEWKNITQVLQSLNYSKGEVDMALNYIRKENQSGANFDLLMRQALSFLAKRI